MLKKNSVYWLKTSFSLLSRFLLIRRVQIFILAFFVLGGVNMYQYKQEDYLLMRALSNQRIALKVKKLCKKYNLDPLLISSLIISESSAYPFAVSYVNAKGLMQLMPATALYIAERTNPDLYRQLKLKPGLIFKPEINMSLAMLHLHDTYHYLSTRKWEPALHIYNVGSGAYRRGKRNYNYVNGILNRLKNWRG